MAEHARTRAEPRKTALAAGLIGAGLMAATDEIVFHQILAWHHFFDRATPALGLLSDGLLHAAELIALVAGAFLFWELRGRQAVVPSVARAWALIGAGGFQLFDGIVNHKLLRLHQVRYVDPLWPYDLAWNLAGLLLLALGLWLARGQGLRR